MNNLAELKNYSVTVSVRVNVKAESAEAAHAEVYEILEDIGQPVYFNTVEKLEE